MGLERKPLLVSTMDLDRESLAFNHRLRERGRELGFRPRFRERERESLENFEEREFGKYELGQILTRS